MDKHQVAQVAIDYYREQFGLDISDYIPAPVPALPMRQPDPFAAQHQVIIPTRAAVSRYPTIWQSLARTNYSLNNCAHAIVSLIFDRRGAGRQMLGLDAMEITHAVLAALHGDEYLLNDRVHENITAVLMCALPPLWESVAQIYSVVAESVVGDSFVSGVHFDRWQGQDLVLLVETFSPTFSCHATPVI